MSYNETKTVKISDEAYEFLTHLRDQLRLGGLNTVPAEIRALAGNPTTITLGATVALAVAVLRHGEKVYPSVPHGKPRRAR